MYKFAAKYSIQFEQKSRYNLQPLANISSLKTAMVYVLNYKFWPKIKQAILSFPPNKWI